MTAPVYPKGPVGTGRADRGQGRLGSTGLSPRRTRAVGYVVTSFCTGVTEKVGDRL